MSLILNVVKDLKNDIIKGDIGFDYKVESLRSQNMQELSENFVSNLGMGSKTCPVASECRDVV